jgi:hypothetical protein
MRPVFRHACLLALLACTLIPGSAGAAAVTLYDGALGGTPSTQGMLFQGTGGSQSFAAGLTTLDTSLTSAAQAGYTAKLGRLPVLNRVKGFTLRFTVQLDAESHAGSDKNGDGVDDRAGFSVIALASDGHGVELGFWPDQVWAQAGGAPGDGPQFTHAEGAPLNTTLQRAYALTIRGERYELRAGDTLVLAGPLRNYSSFGAPYNLPSFVFLGDDTTSAAAVVRIASVAASTTEATIWLPLVIR